MLPILFVSHNASRTGAPTVLLHLCRWLSHRGRPFEVVLGDGGDLTAQFDAIGPTTVLGMLAEPSQALERLSRLAQRVKAHEFAVVYGNTVESADIVTSVADTATPVLTHVHELGFWIEHHTTRARFDRLHACTDTFVAVSRAVRRHLTDVLHVEGDAVALVHECIDTARWSAGAHDLHSARASLGIAASAAVVVAAGTLDWRKGPDLFVQAAGAVRRLAPHHDVHWVWIGGQKGGRHVAALRHDAARLGVTDSLHVVGDREDPAPLLRAGDIFVSTSREDPFPLVTLEAAAVGMPVICFQDAGGAEEFVDDDAGFVVPYLDVDTMARRIVALVDDPDRRAACGTRARTKVRERHDVAVTMPVLVDVIDRTIAAGPTPARLARQDVMGPATLAGPGHGFDAGLLALYRLASARAAAGEVVRARVAFEMIADEAKGADPDLAGKAWYKAATLAGDPGDVRRCCERALAALPTHRAARALLDRLDAGHHVHG